MSWWPLKPNPRDISVLSFLEGLWAGEGTASYTSIKITKFFDEINFELDKPAGVISYMQKTWHNISGKKGDTLHMESGFLRVVNHGIELINSQRNGRLEIMQALVVSPGVQKKLYLVSSKFVNDPRMIKIRRDISIENGIMNYEMKLSTKTNKELTTHYVSVLKKIDNK